MSALETIDIKNGLHVLLLKIELSIENATNTETKLKREAQRELLARAITHISLLDDKIAHYTCLLYTSPSPRDRQKSRMPSSA